MSEKLIIIICELLLGIGIFTGIIVVISATWYDLRAIAHRKYRAGLVRAMRKPRQLRIVVLVYAHNNSRTIADCLRSIARSHYKKFQIIVIDDKSRDDTKQRVRAFQKRHGKTPLQLFAKRKATNRLSALEAGYKKASANDLVLTLDATDTIPPTLLKQTAAQFALNDTPGALRLHHTVNADPSFSLLIRKFILLSKNLFYKAAPSVSVRPRHTGHTGIVFRSPYFTQKQPPTKQTSHYASDLTVTNAVPTLAWSYSTTWLPRHIGIRSIAITLLLLVPVVMTYFFYTAATLQSNVLLTLSWLMLALWLLVAVLSDETQTLLQKIGLIFCVPVMYILFYVQLLVMLLHTISRPLLATNVWPRFVRLLSIRPADHVDAVR